MLFDTRILFCLMTSQIISHLVSASTPCPRWQGGVYVNRKCFQTVGEPLKTWFEAKAICLGQGDDVKLAEPRTLSELEYILNLDDEVWIGAIQYQDEGFHFVSDNATVNLFNYSMETQESTRPLCLLRTSGVFEGYNCGNMWNNVKQVCEKKVPVFSGASMDIVANEYTSDLQTLIVVYRGLGDVIPVPYGSITVSGPSDVKTIQFPTIQMNEANTIQSSSVEVVTSHPMTLTLWYDAEFVAIRFLLHPFLVDVWRVLANPSYTISTPTLHKKYFLLSVLSMDAAPNDIEIVFIGNYYSGDYISMDSIRLVNPKSIEASLAHQQSLNIYGTLTLDGSRVKTSREAAVYVIIYGAAPNDTNSNVSSVHQTPSSKTSSRQYVTFPSKVGDETGSDVYKLITTRKNTTITVDSGVHTIPKMGTAFTISLPNNQSFLVHANKPFHISRVFGVASNIDTSYDACTTPLTTHDMWDTQYTTSTKWMYHVTSVTLHIVLSSGNQTESVYRDDINMPLECSHVTGLDRYVACHHELPPAALLPSSITIRAPEPFGAYAVWNSSGVTGCQVLGIDWYGDWLTDGHQYASNAQPTTDTTPMAASTTTGHSHSLSTYSPAPTPFSGNFANSGTEMSKSGATGNSSHDMCRVPGLMAITNLSAQELDEIVDRIHKVLQIDVTMTSSFIRSKSSAKDHRPSSAGIGLSGVAFVIIILAMVVVSDILTCLCKATRTRPYDVNKVLKNGPPNNT